ncbi:synaptonemal complex protein 1 isoform X2 [Anabrus simplex]|uniref:synaptonemal complex protein 1 isoform X2 n=1 Tax=Anabrus simplex TaxID=316456 RepID=UPI0034DCCB57
MSAVKEMEEGEPSSLGWDYTIELECLRGPEDLQLAAELGKTLLERNKELENCLKQHQNVIEDQTQEIEYLTKQTAALREVNDSRLRIYEQLEVSIQELERTNQRLALDNGADKKHIKSLCMSIETLEARCEELQRALDEVNAQKEVHKQLAQLRETAGSQPSSPTSATETSDKTVQHVAEIQIGTGSESDETFKLLVQIQDMRSQRTKDKHKVAELEEQLAKLLQENLSLEERLNLMQQKEEDMKSLQEEIMTLEEVRQGQLCKRCLRTIDTRDQDELSLVLDREEDDDVSVVNSITSETHCSTVMLQIQNDVEDHHEDNPYRILVEKYEALLEMQRHPASSRHQSFSANNCLSLQEELQMSGDFNSFQVKDSVESDHEEVETTEIYQKDNSNNSKNNKARKQNGSTAEKAFSTTPTDFSEAETSSSGFSDETSNKGTQTEGHLLPPGSFLCSIADGDDCRFSIYDDASPIESRFRKTPEYRQLFREIFAVLKRAAEAKDEGEQLPLLDDLTPLVEAPKVPPVTPAKEDVPVTFPTVEKVHEVNGERAVNFSTEKKEVNTPENTQMIPDSTTDSTSVTTEDKEEAECSQETSSKPAPKKDYLEYLSVGVGIKKKSRKNSPIKNLKASMTQRVERLEQLTSIGIGMSFTTGRANKKRKDIPRYVEDPNRDGSSSAPLAGSTSYNVWSRRSETSSPQDKSNFTRRESSDKSWDYQPYISTASQEVAKLKRLEKSYAEVLRFGPQKVSRSIVNHHYQHNHNHHHNHNHQRK